MHGRFRLTVLKAAASGAGCREGCRRGKLDVGVVDGALDVSPALGADHPAGDDELAPRHDGVS